MEKTRRGARIRTRSDFPSETTRPGREGSEIFEVLEEKYHRSKIILP